MTSAPGVPLPLGQVLHIGAGTGTDLPAYLRQGARAVTLVEPDPESGALLQEAASGHPGVRVIAAAVTAAPRPVRLYRFGFADLNALARPTGLCAVFPGLEELGAETVTGLDPVALVDGLELDETGPHLLVLEAPGQALDILRALHEAGRLAGFAAVRVQEGRRPLYEGAATLEAVRAYLDEAGFPDLVARDDADPERPVITLRADPARALRAALAERAAETARLDSARDAAQARAAAAEDALAEARAEIGALRGAARDAEARQRAQAADLAERTAELAARGAALDTAREALARGEADRDALAAERDRLRTEGAALDTRLADQAAALQAAEAERDRLRAESRTLTDRLEERDAALAEARAAQDKAEAALAELRGALETAQKDAAETPALRARLARLEEAAETHATDLRMAIHLQRVAQSDLGDLQARLAALQAEKATQDALLAEVADCLAAAAPPAPKARGRSRDKAGGAAKPASTG